MATFDNIVLDRLSATLADSVTLAGTEIHAIFTNKQGTCKSKKKIRVALKRTVVQIRKEISKLNRTPDPNN